MAAEQIKIIEFKEIGRVSFIWRAVRSLKITIRPFKGVQVTVPRFVSMESAGKFVEEKKSWIKKSQLKLSRYEKNVTVFDEQSQFNTRDYHLELVRHSVSTIKTVIGKGQIAVYYPDFADIRDLRIQTAIRKAIHQAWRIEAQKYLPERLRFLAEQFHLKYEKVTVRDNKTRWGSCSRDNNIILNIHLMRLPQQLCDYVILHELAHIMHKHHQRAYWQYLDVLTQGKARQLDKELSKYSPVVW